ncbi:MAG: flagellin, partial [Thaumarchaeota archaeon]|nr:flagellin [Nitrososphaerota archaeon]
GIGDVSTGVLNATVIPLKIAGGGISVSLNPNETSVAYYSNTVRYDDIFGNKCVLTSATYQNVTGALDAADTAGCIDKVPITGTTKTEGTPSTTQAVLYWSVSNTPINDILDSGEHANLAIVYKSTDRPGELDNIKAEIIVPTGSALTVERQIPSVTTSIVDLG